MKYPLTEKQIFPFKPKPFFFITTSNPEELTVEEFTKTLTHLKETGFGGIVLFNKPIEGFNAEKYLSDAWFSMIENVAIACKNLGLDMWINDGFDYPPGDVAGKVYKIAPELKQKRIKLVDGNPTVEEVPWGFPAFEEKRSGELFRELVYEQYKKHVGKYFNDPITTFFSDTDNRRVQPSAMFNENSPMRDYFPWSTDFESSFKDAYGYDIMPYIKDVLQRKDIPQAADYWEHAGRLFQRWFKGNHEWMKENNLKYTGHSSDSSPYLQTHACRSSAFTEGRFSDIQSCWDYPGTDQELYAIDGGKHMVKENYYEPSVSWGDIMRVPKMTKFCDVSEDMRAKQAGATAFMYDKEGVMCEMNAASNFGVEPSVLKHIAAFQIMQGVTQVVMSEYQHRYLDQIKYFAPPDYSKWSMLQYSMDVVNKEIAELTYMMQNGKSVFPVVMIDPTEYVWRNNFDHVPYLDTFAKLNRLPYGFTICDADKIINNDYGFKVAVVSGITLPEDIKTAVENKGIVVITDKELDRLSTLIDCPVSYQGQGTPHFVRKVLDGEEFTFIANIESTEPIKGKIYAYGREKDIILYPGDVRYISKTYDDIPELERSGKPVYTLDKTVPVEFDRPNIMQLEYFKADGQTVTKTCENDLIEFSFESKHELDNLKLYVPYVRKTNGYTILNENKIHIIDGHKNAVDKLEMNGQVLVSYDGKVFDEEYLVYDLPKTAIGKNTIKIYKNAPFDDFARILLEGEFDAYINTDGKFYKDAHYTYNMRMFIPENATTSLTKRSKALDTDKSVALQGQPFYSGAITYKFSAIVEKDGEYRLKFPSVRDAGYLYIDGQFNQKIVKPPYTYQFNLTAGKHDFSFKVYNSMANAMETYLEDGGILAGGVLEKITE